MTRKIFLACCLFSSFCNILSAQQYLVPFRQGHQWGLADEKSNLLVKPQYDQMSWLQDQFFETANEIELHDTLLTAPRNRYIRNKKHIFKGLYYRDKMLLKNEPYSRFEIVANACIVAKSEMRSTDMTQAQYDRFKGRQQFLSLYNLQGKDLYPEQFKRLQKFDTAGISTKRKGRARYILFGSENFTSQFSLFVFDADKQVISHWLLKDSERLKVKEGHYDRKYILFEQKEPNGSKSYFKVSYADGKFKLINLPPSQAPAEENTIEERWSGTGGRGSGMDDLVAVPEPFRDEPKSPVNLEEERRKRFKPYYAFKNDSLYRVVYINEKKYIPLAADLQLIFLNKYQTQNNAIIYKQGGRFGLFDSVPGKPIYDSMAYFGTNYLVGQTMNGKMQYGILSPTAEWIIPLAYDSIQLHLKEMDIDSKAYPSRERFFVLQQKRTYSSSNDKPSPYSIPLSDQLILYKNGKQGLSSLHAGEIFPVEYDTIAMNGLNFTRPRYSEFIILKKKGLSGVASLYFNSKENKYDPNNRIEPQFKYIPCFYIKNYFGIRGFNLFGLYNDQFELMGYATADGKFFAKE